MYNILYSALSVLMWHFGGQSRCRLDNAPATFMNYLTSTFIDPHPYTVLKLMVDVWLHFHRGSCAFSN